MLRPCSESEPLILIEKMIMKIERYLEGSVSVTVVDSRVTEELCKVELLGIESKMPFLIQIESRTDGGGCR